MNIINKALGILENASEHGPTVDAFLELCHWFMAALFIGWSSYFLYAVWRFNKKRHPKADYYGVRSHTSTHIEASVILIEAVLLLGFALPLWGRRMNDFDDAEKAGALKVRAVGFQFGWHFHYTGADGKFGRQNVRFITGTNPLGVDPADPNGKDDFWSKNDLRLVNFKPTVVRVTSLDVIHGLALHQMRIQQDAIPGTEAQQWFRPVKTGRWEIICAQLCGSGHYSMRAEYEVMDQAGFDAFAKEQLDLRKTSEASAAPKTAGL